MDPRVSLITLAVADLDAARQFYEALGWVNVASEDGIVSFNLLSQSLSLYPRESLARDLGMDPSDIRPSPAITLAHNVPSEADVDRIMQLAQSSGAKIVKPAVKVFWGGYSGYFTDPEGHMWEVAYNPFSPLREDGAFCWGGFDTSNS